MYAAADKLTESDIVLLMDAQRSEKPRTSAVYAEVPDGVIVRSEERREMFTFHADGIGTWRFDVRAIKDAILGVKIAFGVFKCEIEDSFYQHVLANNGVEEGRLADITERDMERPGIMVHWPDGHSTLIDGNHRMCRRYQLNKRTFRFIMVMVEDCEPFMCRPGDEQKLMTNLREPGAEVLHSEIKLEGLDDRLK